MTNGYARQPQSGGEDKRTPLGLVVDGSLSQGIEVRLDPDASIEDIKVGAFVTIQGQHSTFFGTVTDVTLGSTDPRLKHTPPQVDDALVLQVVSGTVAYGAISVLPNLVLPTVLGDAEQAPAAAKTIPPYFAPTYLASQRDVELVFGQEDQKHFWIGSPLDMEHKLCLNLDELVKRSIGVFGKSGTGKTFLTRLLLVGILQGGTASSLVFDMHSEYGWSGQDTDHNLQVKGLKQLFPSRVSTFTLDEESSRRRGSSPDEVATIGYEEIEPEDVELLRETFNLSDVAAAAAYNLQQHFGRNWMGQFLEAPDINELARDLNVNVAALATLHNRLSRLRRYEFLKQGDRYNTAAKIIEHLERGQHVVLEFGRYGNDLTAYILVSNLLSRRIHQRYVELKEEAEGGRGKEPRPLIIVIEEAHKFLSPSVAPQTIFGIIARELRKYNVTLMVIDQRPSGIDEEVMSQLGTRLTCLLDNDRDIDAVLSGASGSRQLRGVLARLESKQQALIFGHAVPMPVVVHTRDYGTAESYALLAQPNHRSTISQRSEYPEQEATETLEDRRKREIDELFS
jgi:DNA helicase HerA-like ATPase